MLSLYIRLVLSFVSLTIATLGLVATPVVDLDGDGLSDIWQIAFDANDLAPSADTDGDGYTNAEECEHGTDPLDASSHFESYRIEADENGVAFLFDAVENQSYTIETSSDLVNWNKRGDTVLSSGGNERLVGRHKGEAVRFMRFRIGGDQDGDGISDFEESLLGYDPLSQYSGSGFVGGDMARLMNGFYSQTTFEIAGKQVQGVAPTLAEASRFLTQAALGSKMEDIEAVATMGYSAWIDDQFQQELGLIEPRVDWWYENEENVFYVHRRYAWWEQIMTSSDLLRQRMAVALGEIYVLSDSVLDGGAATTGMAHFYDMLLKNSFGNWRDLLRDVSLHPAMGFYLSHLQNRKANEAKNRYPDENYAREIMQLFSIGLFELNPDGTRMLDEDGYDIPTYDNEDITNFARVFTGFAYGGSENDTSIDWHFRFGERSWNEPMKVWLDEHDTDKKILLRGKTLPSFENDPGRVPMDDFDDAIDNLYNHSNVGPFVCYRLIQRLVKSNPSPEYVQRVGQVFDDNGSGVRGDMGAVVKAILLDVESRSLAAYSDPHAGRLREPYLRWVRLVKSLDANSKSGLYLIPDWSHLRDMGQRSMSANSVFNFFLPNYVPSGEMADAGLVGPEFQILTETTALATQNIYGNAFAWGFGRGKENRMTFEMPAEVELLDNGDLEGLIDRLDLILCHGTLREGTKQILRDAYAGRPGWFDTRRSIVVLVRIIILSPEFSVTM